MVLSVETLANVVASVIHGNAHGTFGTGDEYAMQHAVQVALSHACIAVDREYALSRKDIIDFLTREGVGIEVKLAGTTNALIRQLHRYAQHREVLALVVVTNRSRLTQMPRQISGKPVRVASLLHSGL